jgi:hypothetical protein
MAGRDNDDDSGVPEGGKAAARQRQFMESRGLVSDENNDEEDSQQPTRDAASDEQDHGDTDKDGS